jgi:hypothetical protein
MTDQPAVVAIVAATLRKAADHWLYGEPGRDELFDVADQVEWGWNDGCCPFCQETFCDEDCPLAEVRAEQDRLAERMERGV